MPSPNDFKDLIVSATGDLCEKLNKLFQLPQKFYDWYSGIYTESNAFTEAENTKLCALIATCSGGTGGGGGPDNPAMPTPENVNATDGTYDNKVRVTWNTVTPPAGAVTEYKIYRALSTISDPTDGSVVLLATVTAPTISYDDTSAVQGTIYNYWVTATDGVNTSAYGGPDNGSASAPTTTLDAISDLRCTKGFSLTGGGVIGLVFTAPTGATRFDIYRHTVDDSSTAVKIASDVLPFLSTTCSGIPSGTKLFDNGNGQMLYQDTPPSSLGVYYYWVIARKSSPPAVSPFSNSDTGWDHGAVGGFTLSTAILEHDGASLFPPSGTTTMRVLIFGSGGGGAGGGQVYGGGGGGGGGLVIEEFAVTDADELTLEASPNADDTGNAGRETSAADGPDLVFKINAVSKITVAGGGGGVYAPSGGGAGGILGSGTGTASPLIYDGVAGEAASGSKGGGTGYLFGSRRYKAANCAPGFDGNGDIGIPGGGSYPNPSAPTFAIGGFGGTGYALIWFGA